MIKTSKQILSSIKENEVQYNSIVNVYPNPTLRILNINVTEELNIHIYNISGMELARFNSLDKNIDISSFESGVYFLKIFNSEDSFSVKKIIKL